MIKVRNKLLSFFLILSLFVGIVGVINVDTSYAASKKIHLKKTTVSLAAGKTYQQKLINANGKTIGASRVKWRSSKPSVAKINKKGKITAVKAGTAKMTAKYNGKTYSFKVRVIGLRKKSISLLTGEKYQQKLINYNGKAFSATSVKWKSSKPSVAKISSSGKITAVKSGTTTMTAKYKGKTYKFKVSVSSALELLQYYISTDGYTNGNGDQTIEHAISSTETVYFVDLGDSIEFHFFSYYDTSDYESSTHVTMVLDVPEDDFSSPNIRVEIGDYYFTAHSYVTTSDYSSTDELYFYRDEGNTPTSVSIQDLCNSSFRAAMASWELSLYELYGLGLSDLGFVSY